MKQESYETDGLYDADITPGASDEPMVPKDEDHASNVGAFADGGAAASAGDDAHERPEITGVGAGNLQARRKKDARD